MNKTLYFVSYRGTSFTLPDAASGSPAKETVEENTVFGVKPHSAKDQARYEAMTRRASLTEDVDWNEAKLQAILRKADFWEGFPLSDAVLVRTEFKPGDVDQRIDMLFLTSAAELVPCELKIRGDYPDSHGQLIRYIADLTLDPWDLQRLLAAHQEYVSKITDETILDVIRAKFATFIAANTKIPPSRPLAVRAGGFIMDVEFKPATQLAVRYLNEHLGMKIELIKVTTYVEDAWRADADERLMKVVFATALAPE